MTNGGILACLYQLKIWKTQQLSWSEINFHLSSSSFLLVFSPLFLQQCEATIISSSVCHSLCSHSYFFKHNKMMEGSFDEVWSYLAPAISLGHLLQSS